MNPRTLVLAGAIAVLLVALWFFFLFQPRNDEIAEIEEEIAAAEQEIATVRREIRDLEEVRERAAEIESLIVASEAVVPSAPALPSVVRQLQLAADDSGVRLLTISPGRPTEAPLEEGPENLAALSLTMDVEGGYFQMVDFLRRIEDPSIVARGIQFTDLGMSVAAYPTLAATLNGTMYARLTVPGAPGVEQQDGEQQDGEAPDGEQPTEPGATATDGGQAAEEGGR